MNLNKAMLIGRLTRDPEMRYTPSGAPVTTFSLATNRYGQGPDGEKKEYTDYHNIVVWNIGKRNLAEICGQYLHKGSLVYLEG
ncbi:MAG: single-stranded DNA-binding protein, partial [Chloroflexi bacterium]